MFLVGRESLLFEFEVAYDDTDWPSLPPSPLKGNNMRPLHQSFSGVDPGADWHYN